LDAKIGITNNFTADKEEEIYNLLSGDPVHIDDLLEDLGIGILDLSSALLKLELKKKVVSFRENIL
jgi:predicted Rossmann fold nucleotide-binding protein DprA/Smf involved in DNA uptake